MNEKVHIEINKSTFEFLEALVHELLTQDNRATANPRYYTIMEEKYIYGMEPNYSDDIVYISLDHETICETLKEAICTESEYRGESIPANIEECEFLEKYRWNSTRRIKLNKFSNCFLTERAAEHHIAINGHNLKHPSTFLCHAYRNPELDGLIKAIIEIVNQNIGCDC